MRTTTLPSLPHEEIPPDLAAHLRTSPGTPNQRKFLTMSSRSAKTVSWVWVDDTGTCDHMHPRDQAGNVYWSKWHLYQFRVTDKNGLVFGDMPHRKIAFRCPSTLEDNEKFRVRADLPPGVMKDVLAEAQRAVSSRKPEKERSGYDYGDS